MNRVENPITINFSVNAMTRQFFVQLHNALKLLFSESLRSGGVNAKLLDWNNDCGIEFDMLQKVFPGQLPLSEGIRVRSTSPSATFVELSELVLFCSVATQVDASFQIGDSNEEMFSIHDGAIQIETRSLQAKSSIIFSE